jgi:DNA-binding MurR/RpiR family transcriptional regulator
MGQGRQLGAPMEASSGLRPARRWRLLLAHDAAAPTCDDLPDAILDALGNVDVVDASSMEDARVTLGASNFDVCLVCLDLPPAPSAGARLAREMIERGVPVVLVTRSQRWIPSDSPELRTLPWMAPDATPTDVANAVGAAVASHGLSESWATQDEDAAKPLAV